MRITCRLEFDAGHRIPDHRSQCQYLHGHRYALEITLSGKLIARKGAPDRGMVMDFADLKRIAREHLINAWDHAFVAYSGDTPVLDFLGSLENHKTVVFDAIPTAENLSIEAFRILNRAYRDHLGTQLRLERIRLYETPSSWADARAEDCISKDCELVKKS
jgi:6-pyruvoyltetrahydropterin/6-carboxytetrahydropterin synthase